MEMAEIRNNVTAKDRQTIAQLYNVSEVYVGLLLMGKRETKSETASRIIKDLEIMANINFLAELAKQDELQAA